MNCLDRSCFAGAVIKPGRRSLKDHLGSAFLRTFDLQCIRVFATAKAEDGFACFAEHGKRHCGVHRAIGNSVMSLVDIGGNSRLRNDHILA